MKFIVQGRRFNKQLHAITFAHRLAAEQDESVDVYCEVGTDMMTRRFWACRMHPPGRVQTLMKRPDLEAVA